MNLLYVSFQHPWPPDIGIRQRHFYLIQELARNHRVTVASLLPFEGEDRAGWDEFARAQLAGTVEADCRTWQPPESPPGSRWAGRLANLKVLFGSPLPRVVQDWDTPAAVAFFGKLRREVPCDVAWVDRGYFAHLARRAGFPRIAVDVDEVETILRRRNHALSAKSAHGARVQGPRDLAWHERLELAKLERYEKSLSGKFWRVLVCKEDDRQFLGDPRGNVHVVPNGIPIYGPHAPGREAPGRLMFVGAMDYAPNDDAASWFATAILPRVRAADPAAHFVAAGQNPRPELLALHDGEAVRVTGRVPSLVPYYESAAVVVTPLRLGSGTRLKVLEALSHGKALVATQTAVEGLNLVPGEHFLLAETAEAIADACVALLGDPARRAELGARGRDFVTERFHWGAVGKLAEAALKLEPAS